MMYAHMRFAAPLPQIGANCMPFFAGVPQNMNRFMIGPYMSRTSFNHIHDTPPWRNRSPPGLRCTERGGMGQVRFNEPDINIPIANYQDPPSKHVYVNGTLYNTELLSNMLDKHEMQRQQVVNSDDESYDPMEENLPPTYGIRFYNPHYGPEGAVPVRKIKKKKPKPEPQTTNLPPSKPPAALANGCIHFKGRYPYGRDREPKDQAVDLPETQPETKEDLPETQPETKEDLPETQPETKEEAKQNDEPQEPKEEVKQNGEPQEPKEEEAKQNGVHQEAKSSKSDNETTKLSKKRGKRGKRSYRVTISFGIVALAKRNNKTIQDKKVLKKSLK